MRRFRYFLIMAVLIMMISCKGNAQQAQGIEELKKRIHASQEFKQYVEATKKIIEGATSGRVSISGISKADLDSALSTSRTEDEYAKKLKVLGVKGAEEYASTLFAQTTAMLNVVRKNPELRGLSREELHKIWDISQFTNRDSKTIPLPQKYNQ